MALYDQYGKVTIKSGTTLYHYSPQRFNKINNNSFFCLNNINWNQRTGYLYTFVTLCDIDLILTITSEDIVNKNKYTKFSKDDQVLTDIFNEFSDADTQYYPKPSSDFCLKHDHKTYFSFLCKNVASCGYHGFFNRIETDNRFEIVIFDSSCLKLLNRDKVENITQQHDEKDDFEIMCSSNIKFTYPHKFKFDKFSIEYHEKPSIFYFIYRQLYRKNK